MLKFPLLQQVKIRESKCCNIKISKLAAGEANLQVIKSNPSGTACIKYAVAYRK